MKTENRKTFDELEAWLKTLPRDSMFRAYQGPGSCLIAESPEGKFYDDLDMDENYGVWE